MTIEVRCPNGHRLRVAAKHAGKSGRCPHCRALVRVPRLQVSEDDILSILGPPPKSPAPRRAAVSAEGVQGWNPPRSGHANQSDAYPSDSSILRRQKSCSNCGRTTSFSFKWCPGCGERLTDHVPVPQATSSQ